MPSHVVRIAFAVLLSLTSAVSAVPAAAASSIMIVAAFARASAVPTATSGAAYVSVMNHAAEPDRLIAAASPAAASASIHRTQESGGVVSMQEAGPLDIAPMATLEMKPGGYHIMLNGLLKPLKEGDEIDVTLTFENAGDVTVKVTVGGVAAGSHDHGSETGGSSSGG